MSDFAGFLCSPAGVAQALQEARALNDAIRARGVACARPQDAAKAVQWRQMAKVSEAVLAALDHYLARGGGSRGSRAIVVHGEGVVPFGRHGPLPSLHVRSERAQDRDERILVRRDGDSFACTAQPVKRRETTRRSYFERDWPAYLTGARYR